MTFQELQAKNAGALTQTDWHQHKGGGWVNKAAKIADDVKIGEFAIVWGGTIWGGTIRGGTIRGGTIWGGTIEGGTIWGGTIEGGTIRGGTIWGGIIWGGIIWGGTIWGGTIEGGTIWGGEWGDNNKSILFLMDSRGYGATNSKPGYLRIGCELHTFAEWKSRFPAIAHRHNLTKEEIAEYKAIIALFAKLGK